MHFERLINACKINHMFFFGRLSIRKTRKSAARISRAISTNSSTLPRIARAAFNHQPAAKRLASSTAPVAKQTVTPTPRTLKIVTARPGQTVWAVAARRHPAKLVSPSSPVVRPATRPATIAERTTQCPRRAVSSWPYDHHQELIV